MLNPENDEMEEHVKSLIIDINTVAPIKDLTNLEFLMDLIPKKEKN